MSLTMWTVKYTKNEHLQNIQPKRRFFFPFSFQNALTFVTAVHLIPAVALLVGNFLEIHHVPRRSFVK